MTSPERHLDAAQKGIAHLATPLTDEERRDLNLFLEREAFENTVTIDGDDRVAYKLPHGSDNAAHEKIGRLEEYLKTLQEKPPRFGADGMEGG